MDVKECVEKLCNEIKELLSENAYIKDTQELIMLEPHLDIFSKIVNSVSKVSNDYKLINAWKCISKGINEEKSINELYNYVRGSQERAFYISDSFKKIILSNSNIASSVLAYVIGEIVSGDRDFAQEDVIIYDALSHMTDFDIRNFVDIIDNYVGVEDIGSEYINIYSIPDDKKAAYILTLKLCVNVRLLDFQSTVFTGEFVNSGEFYKSTLLAGNLREYIAKTNQLLNY